MSGSLDYNKYDKFVFYFCLIDILFLPYVSFVAVSYSFFVLIPWLFLRFNQLMNSNKDFKLYCWLVVFVLFSSFVGGVIHTEDMRENIMQGLRILQGVGCFFLFSYYLQRYTVKIKTFLMIFVAFVVLFCILYNIDKSSYSSLVSFWNPRGLSSTASLYNDLEGYRFSFVWMDPNNIAYMIVGVVMFVFTNEKSVLIEKLFLIISLVFVLISAMSSGGMTSLLITIVVYGVCMLFKKWKFGGEINITSVFVMLLSPMLFIFIKKLWEWFSNTSTALESFNRLEGNSLDSRLNIWTRIIDNTNFFKYAFFGYGGITYVAGIKTKPHNGHFYLILAFGFIAYFLYMYIVFRKRKETPFKNYIWILPVFLGFTVNIMIGEVKLAGLIMLLVAATSSKKYLSDRRCISDE